MYKESKIDKLKNIIIKDNCRLVYDQLRNNFPETFRNFFTLNAQLHKHNSRKNKFILSKIKSITYGSNSVTLKAIKQWNEIQNFVKIDIYSPYISKICRKLYWKWTVSNKHKSYAIYYHESCLIYYDIVRNENSHISYYSTVSNPPKEIY